MRVLMAAQKSEEKICAWADSFRQTSIAHSLRECFSALRWGGRTNRADVRIAQGRRAACSAGVREETKVRPALDQKKIAFSSYALANAPRT